MSLDEEKNIIKEELMSGQIRTALQKILDSKHFRKHHNDIIILCQRLDSLLSHEIRGTLSDNEIKIEKNSITKSILQVLDPAPFYIVKAPMRIGVSISFVLLFIIFYYFIFFNRKNTSNNEGAININGSDIENKGLIGVNEGTINIVNNNSSIPTISTLENHHLCKIYPPFSAKTLLSTLGSPFVVDTIEEGFVSHFYDLNNCYIQFIESLETNEIVITSIENKQGYKIKFNPFAGGYLSNKTFILGDIKFKDVYNLYSMPVDYGLPPMILSKGCMAQMAHFSEISMNLIFADRLTTSRGSLGSNKCDFKFASEPMPTLGDVCFNDIDFDTEEKRKEIGGFAEGYNTYDYLTGCNNNYFLIGDKKFEQIQQKIFNKKIEYITMYDAFFMNSEEGKHIYDLMSPSIECLE